MVKKRTTEEMRAYQRQRRARLKGTQILADASVPPDTTLVAPEPLPGETDAELAGRSVRISNWGANRAQPGSLLKRGKP